MNVSMADMPSAIDKKTCRLIPNHNVNVMLAVNCFQEVRLSMLQKGTKRIAGKGHWHCIVRPRSCFSFAFLDELNRHM